MDRLKIIWILVFSIFIPLGLCLACGLYVFCCRKKREELPYQVAMSNRLFKVKRLKFFNLKSAFQDTKSILYLMCSQSIIAFIMHPKCIPNVSKMYPKHPQLHLKKIRIQKRAPPNRTALETSKRHQFLINSFFFQDENITLKPPCQNCKLIEMGSMACYTEFCPDCGEVPPNSDKPVKPPKKQTIFQRKSGMILCYLCDLLLYNGDT